MRIKILAFSGIRCVAITRNLVRARVLIDDHGRVKTCPVTRVYVIATGFWRDPFEPDVRGLFP